MSSNIAVSLIRLARQLNSAKIEGSGKLPWNHFESEKVTKDIISLCKSSGLILRELIPSKGSKANTSLFRINLTPGWKPDPDYAWYLKFRALLKSNKPINVKSAEDKILKLEGVLSATLSVPNEYWWKDQKKQPLTNKNNYLLTVDFGLKSEERPPFKNR